MKCFRIFILAIIAVLAAGCFDDKATDFRLESPDGTLVVTISASDSLNWSVSRRGVPLLERSAIGLRFADGFTLGQGVRIGKVQRRQIERTVKAPFYRQAEFEECCNELRIELGNDCAVTFRAYDEGCAYRFETGFEDDRIVRDEIIECNFAGSPALQAAFSDGLCNAFQFPYTYCRADTLPTDKLIILPLAADCGEAGRVLVCESDLEAYPGMFLVPHEGRLRGRFACVPDSCYLHEQRCQEKVVTRQDFIARVQGTRSYPWRILAVADEDREFPVNNLVYALASENRIGDCSWVRPGKVAWEWWNDWGLTDVGFKPGIDTRTYKAYIDFAAEYGLEYVVLDEGWSDPRSGDVMRTIPAIDLPELVRYADSKGVGLMLWVVGNVLDDRLEEACDYYANLGIKGFKVDFIDRDDQQAVELVYRLGGGAAPPPRGSSAGRGRRRPAADARHSRNIQTHGIESDVSQYRQFRRCVRAGGTQMEQSRHAYLRCDIPFHPYGAGTGGLYARSFQKCHAQRFQDRLPQADEPGYACPSGCSLYRF